jgi:uncharacterized protein (DUF488 family)
LLQLLKHHGVDLLVDVRTVPASRRMPHFAKSALNLSLPAHGIAYEHMPELGGLRKARPDSTNLGWRNVSFRAYADYMQQDEFAAGVDRLLEARSGPAGHLPMNGEEIVLAIMCAEAVPWRCHRSLIADALTVRGVEVRHVTGTSDPSLHKLTPFARVEGMRISYPAPDTLAL